MPAASLDDPIAEALWQARATGRPLEGALAGERIDQARAEAVAAELYDALRREGGRQIGWKLGATDPAAQAFLSTAAPFAAPLYSHSLLEGTPARLSISKLVAPRLEAEIAVSHTPQGVLFSPCVEIVDCRFPDWNVDLQRAVADFGLQGRISFGAPIQISMTETVDVVVLKDYEIVAQGRRSIAEALHLLEFVRDELQPGLPVLVATGTLITPMPLEQGTWRCDFGPLGALTIDVVP